MECQKYLNPVIFVSITWVFLLLLYQEKHFKNTFLLKLNCIRLEMFAIIRNKTHIHTFINNSFYMHTVIESFFKYRIALSFFIMEKIPSNS